MGCSASRPNTHFTTPADDLSPSLSSSPNLSSKRQPISRTISLLTPLVHHPPLRKGDTDHLVSLTSTTYGSLILINNSANPNFNGHDQLNHSPTSSSSSSPDSVINTWELMDGLDDFPIESPKKLNSYQNSDCDGSVKKLLDSYEIVEEESSIIKPLWQHLSEESLLAKMDPNVVSSYRRALSSRHLGPKNHQMRIRSMESSPMNFSTPKRIGSLDSTPITFPEPIIMESFKSESEICLNLPGTKDKIVMYITSLRGIRKTYEDCCTIRMIFRGFRVFVDERDISMDSAYKKELQNVLGKKAATLPQIFIRGKYVGGADEVKILHEIGELGKLLEGFPIRELGLICKSCGDARFVPCQNCNGSRKVFEEEGQLRRCADCNENGLIRCSNCCS